MEDQHIQQLQDYIRQQYRSGLQPNEIAQQLQTVGWPAEVIQQAFAVVQAEMVPNSYAQPNPAANASATSQTGSEVPAANGKKRGRIRTGWQLFKISFGILRGNKYLLRYLLLTVLSVVAVLIVFIIVFLLGHNVFFPKNYYGGNGMSVLGYIVTFVYYVSIYFSINFFAAALAANILDIFKGQRQPYQQYLRAAWSRAGTIFFFSIISATVGFILNYVVERIRYIGWILSWILGTAWSLGTMFVLPILMNDPRVSAPGSIKQSVKFFKATWGESVTAKVSVNGPLALINLAVFALACIFCVVSFVYGWWPLGIFWMFVYWAFAITLIIIGSFANNILNVALFYYANYHRVPPAFNAELLNSVFIKRKRSRLGKKLAPTP